MAPPAGIIVTGKSSRGDGQGAMTGFTLDRTAKKLISLDESNILADRIPAIIRLKKGSIIPVNTNLNHHRS